MKEEEEKEKKEVVPKAKGTSFPRLVLMNIIFFAIVIGGLYLVSGQ